MPFAIRKQGNKFAVVNSETGDTKGTFDSEAEAKKQMAALYANVPDARKDFTEIMVKSALAEMVPVEGDESADGPGTLHAIISSQKRDRDGDQLWADEWEQPLPDHIVINGDHDNNHIMSTVGSGTPTLESDNKVHVRGSYAETEFAQNTRKLVNGKHLRTLSCAYREKKGEKGIRRELINASFVLVPSNTDCVVIDSKSYEMPKVVTKDVVTDQLTPQQRAQAVHDLAVDMGADCGTFAELTADEMKELFGGGVTLKRLKEFDLEIVVDENSKELTVKHSGNVLGTHKFSQAPEAHGDKPSDSTADPAKEAEALAKAKAAVMQMETRHLVNIEGE